MSTSLARRLSNLESQVSPRTKYDSMSDAEIDARIIRLYRRASPGARAWADKFCEERGMASLRNMI